ncbi:hypothetical protein E2562_024761 [Oryza meyeriana var. granulata]|uniref:Uncharacterized protein n=1 Tax=Oryza meyeriana var. granulata TaxID=110450 RepID=A0A6G1FBK7_9ORYZ|nr:hypothetical protein E2562_024761 [Oryza meyeriana var. granulata]
MVVPLEPSTMHPSFTVDVPTKGPRRHSHKGPALARLVIHRCRAALASASTRLCRLETGTAVREIK